MGPSYNQLNVYSSGGFTAGRSRVYTVPILELTA